MSRTDKTAPWRIRVMDKHSFLDEVHNHDNGVCDLPARPTKMCDPLGGQILRDNCYWAASFGFWRDPANNCGCAMCKDSDGRHIKARRARRAGKKTARNWEIEYR